MCLCFEFLSSCQGRTTQQTENASTKIWADGKVLFQVEGKGSTQGRGENWGDWEGGKMAFVNLFNVQKRHEILCLSDLSDYSRNSLLEKWHKVTVVILERVIMWQLKIAQKDHYHFFPKTRTCRMYNEKIALGIQCSFSVLLKPLS